jgi:uncharacterized RDD family membrane protein YckC
MLCANHLDVSERVRRCARCGIPYCPDCLVELAGRPYCAKCKGEQLLDVRSGVDRSPLRLSSIGRRFGAQLLDSLIFIIPLYTVAGIFLWGPMLRGQQPQLWMQLIGIPFSILMLVYEGLMLQFKNGQSLGKMALKIRVVRPDGSPISPGQAWGRVAMRTVLANCCFLIDYIPAFMTPEKTTLHDMVAGTRVVDTFTP